MAELAWAWPRGAPQGQKAPGGPPAQGWCKEDLTSSCREVAVCKRAAVGNKGGWAVLTYAYRGNAAASQGLCKGLPKGTLSGQHCGLQLL